MGDHVGVVPGGAGGHQHPVRERLPPSFGAFFSNFVREPVKKRVIPDGNQLPRQIS